MPTPDTLPFTRADHLRLACATVLGVVGTGAAFATIYATPLPKAPVLSCGIEALSCSAALMSPAAQWGGIPLGVAGVAYFLVWTLNTRAFHRTQSPVFQTALTWATAVGALVSLSLGGYMFGVLRQPCLYCLITHLSNLSACFLLWKFRRWRPAGGTADQSWHFASMTATAALAATTAFFAHDARQARAALAAHEPPPPAFSWPAPTP